MGDTPVYRTWSSMIQRCTNPKFTVFEYYGGRGIAVCDEWLNSFEVWLTYMSALPHYPYDENGQRVLIGYSQDRINNEGDYEPGNMHWATKVEQRLNQRTRTGT